ncbi:AtpZ/AtpI family protein [Reichenbachiella versicolor]|uniref:AtpZ/AtpI family protein n=1 Tax=Reichenbachiella versicolor TaxID=1821036 RepID=UPI0013A52EBE|nr:AtpZ/AtpI family protein [Reichenbachiella versicolor]
MRYTSLAFEMLGFILLGVLGGYKLDQYFHFDKPFMTAGCALLGVLASMIYLIRNLPKSE